MATSKKPRHPRTTDELRAASRHLAYEFDAWSAATWGVAQIAQQAAPTDFSAVLDRARLSMVGTALFQSFAIHARSLMHFGYPGAPVYPTDILAEDFVPNWGSVRPPMAPAFVELKKRVATIFAHLAYERVPLVAEQLTWRGPRSWKRSPRCSRLSFSTPVKRASIRNGSPNAATRSTGLQEFPRSAACLSSSPAGHCRSERPSPLPPRGRPRGSGPGARTAT